MSVRMKYAYSVYKRTQIVAVRSTDGLVRITETKRDHKFGENERKTIPDIIGAQSRFEELSFETSMVVVHFLNNDHYVFQSPTKTEWYIIVSTENVLCTHEFEYTGNDWANDNTDIALYNYKYGYDTYSATPPQGFINCVEKVDATKLNTDNDRRIF